MREEDTKEGKKWKFTELLEAKGLQDGRRGETETGWGRRQEANAAPADKWLTVGKNRRARSSLIIEGEDEEERVI